MIVSHVLLILHKKIHFYIFMFEAWNVAKGRKVQGGRILSQGTVCAIIQIAEKVVKEPDLDIACHLTVSFHVMLFIAIIHYNLQFLWVI